MGISEQGKAATAVPVWFSALPEFHAGRCHTGLRPMAETGEAGRPPCQEGKSRKIELNTARLSSARHVRLTAAPQLIGDGRRGTKTGLSRASSENGGNRKF